MLKGIPVELPAMLECREKRAALQNELINQYNLPLISFCLNIPGPVKTNAEIKMLFEHGLSNIRTVLKKHNIEIAAIKERHELTGDEVIMAVRASAVTLKKLMTVLEEADRAGRLYDIDIIDISGQKLSRNTPRRCLLCDRQAQDCARSRRHTVEELTDKIQEILAEKAEFNR